MFDRLFYLSRSPDVHITNRIEQKPHDPADAARLHGELKRLAEQEVAAAAIERFGAHNELTAVVAENSMDYMKNARMVRIMFNLNGTQHTISMTKDAYLDKAQLYREIAQVILEELVSRMSGRLLP